ncbi:uncharacterized protein LOC119314610 [Triticum dicoccoides]|uniref:uncharacterized protein LOC119314610 n=1 Tax=Triticum dicoccoides TaxID=85692 RepID=UPI001890F263|nr:uncharacterized protein LOC119314610 [Triticum dicoccoides]
MTDLHDKRATSESRRSKRPERSRPEAKVAEPPARRAKRAEGHVPLRKRESARVGRPPHPLDSEGVTAEPRPARRDERSSSPLCGDGGTEEITMAPPPRRAKREDSPDSPRTAYVLRNRRVPDAGDPKPTPPPCFEKREIKLDQPRLSKRQLKRAELWNAPACARKGLERYNGMNQGDEYELVEAVGVKSFCYCGPWLHANFLARHKGASSCDDLVPKHFFAELRIDADGLSCVSCFKFDSVDWKNFGGCGVCPATFVHPAGGGYIGALPERPLQPAPTGLQISFSF